MAKRVAILTAIMVAISIAVFGYFVWDNAGGGAISIHGYIALALGVVLTLGVGGGLMALVFFSARQGYDERGRELHRRG